MGYIDREFMEQSPCKRAIVKTVNFTHLQSF